MQKLKRESDTPGGAGELVVIDPQAAEKNSRDLPRELYQAATARGILSAASTPEDIFEVAYETGWDRGVREAWSTEAARRVDLRLVLQSTWVACCALAAWARMNATALVVGILAGILLAGRLAMMFR